MTRTLLLCSLAAPMLFGGCATTSMIEEPNIAFDNCDANVVARIEKDARRHNSAIRWYRCPQFLPSKELPPFHFGEQRDA